MDILFYKIECAILSIEIYMGRGKEWSAEFTKAVPRHSKKKKVVVVYRIVAIIYLTHKE